MFRLFAPIIKYARGEAEAFGERAKWTSIFRATSAVLFLVAGVFGLLALYIWLAGIVGAVYSALIIAGGLAATATVVMIVAHFWRVAQDRRDAERRRDNQATLMASGVIAAFSAFGSKGKLDRLAIPAVMVGAFLYFVTQKGKPDPDETED